MKCLIRHIALLSCLLVLLSACREEIKLDLDSAPRRLVIDALLTDDSTQTFTVTMSGDFYERELFPAQGATLILTDPQNGEQTLTYDAGGRYVLDGFTPQARQPYLLTVEHEGQTYSAATSFPERVPLLGATFNNNLGGTNFASFSVEVADPIGVPNFYRVKANILNGYVNPALYHLISDEDGNDGDTLNPLFFLGSNLNPGDTVDLELMSIDAAAYAYYQQVSKAIVATNTSNTPFNPMGNFSGDAFGYFGSAAIDTMRFIIP